MKRINLLGLVFVCKLLLPGCEKNDVLDDLILKGKVIRISCASTVVQITNAEKYGEDAWINLGASGEIKYDNVFKVENICKLKLEEDKTFQFKIINLPMNDCIQCLLYDAPPKISYAIELY